MAVDTLEAIEVGDSTQWIRVRGADASNPVLLLIQQVAPSEVLRPYADSLEAPTKHLVWFERSAHTPQLDEPDKFRDLLIRVRDGQLEEHDMASLSEEHGGRP